MRYSSLEIYSLPFYVYWLYNIYVCYIRKIYLKRQKEKIFLIENIQLIFLEDKGRIKQKVENCQERINI